MNTETFKIRQAIEARTPISGDDLLCLDQELKVRLYLNTNFEGKPNLEVCTESGLGHCFIPVKAMFGWIPAVMTVRFARGLIRKGWHRNDHYQAELV